MGDYNGLNATEGGGRGIKGNETPRLLRPAEKPAKTAKIAKDSWKGVDEGLFEVLRTLRRKIADEKHMPTYVIFGDATLRDIARRRPSTRETSFEVNGVAENRCQLYGDAMLEAIQAYCVANTRYMDVQLTVVLKFEVRCLQ